MYSISENDISKIDFLLKSDIQTVTNTTKVFQITWTNQLKDQIFLHYLTCSYSTSHGYFFSKHFPLHPHCWNFPIPNKRKENKGKKETIKKNETKLKGRIKEKICRGRKTAH